MNKNKIYLGDAYKLIKDIPDKSVDLIVTDPPYQIEGIHASGVIKDRYEKSHAKELTDNKLDESIDLKILDDYVRVMRKINIYIWCNKEQIYKSIKQTNSRTVAPVLVNKTTSVGIC